MQARGRRFAPRLNYACSRRASTKPISTPGVPTAGVSRTSPSIGPVSLVAWRFSPPFLLHHGSRRSRCLAARPERSAGRADPSSPRCPGSRRCGLTIAGGTATNDAPAVERRCVESHRRARALRVARSARASARQSRSLAEGVGPASACDRQSTPDNWRSCAPPGVVDPSVEVARGLHVKRT